MQHDDVDVSLASTHALTAGRLIQLGRKLRDRMNHDVLTCWARMPPRRRNPLRR
jgi:hypothetical protein